MAFLQTSGTKFSLSGQPFYLYGCTIYDALFSSHKFTDLPTKLDFVVNSGFNTIRFTNFMTQSATVGSEFDENVYAYIDYVLNECRTRSLKVIFETTDIGTISGLRGYQHGDANNLALFDSYFTWLGARTNTVNSLTYAADDTIGMFSIWGEFGEVTPPLTNRSMFTSIAASARAAFPNTLICSGGLKPEQIVDSSYGYQNYPAEDQLTIPNVGCAATEPYYTQQNMLDLFPSLYSYSVANNKPWFCIEFGYNQSVSSSKHDNVRATQLKFIYDQGLKYGSAGFIFWNHDEGVGGGYGINSRTASCHNIVKSYAKSQQPFQRLKIV